jgi:hypothetical protein
MEVCWCRILMGRMFLLASLRGRFSWLSMSLQNGIHTWMTILQLWILAFQPNFYPPFYFVYHLKSQFLYHTHFSLWYICDFFFFNHSGLTPSNYSELSHIYEKYKTQGMLQQMEDSAVIFSFKIFWKLTLTPNWTVINVSGCLFLTFQKCVHRSCFCFGVVCRSRVGCTIAHFLNLQTSFCKLKRELG